MKFWTKEETIKWINASSVAVEREQFVAFNIQDEWKFETVTIPDEVWAQQQLARSTGFMNE